MTPALLMTGSTDVQPVCSRPVVKIRNRIRISTYQIRLCVNLFKVLQQVYVSLIVHLIVPLFFQRVVKEKLICNTNRFFLQELGGLWRESDCEDLSGMYSQEMMEVGFSLKNNVSVQRLCNRVLRAREAKNVLLAYKNRP